MKVVSTMLHACIHMHGMHVCTTHTMWMYDSNHGYHSCEFVDVSILQQEEEEEQGRGRETMGERKRYMVSFHYIHGKTWGELWKD